MKQSPRVIVSAILALVAVLGATVAIVLATTDSTPDQGSVPTVFTTVQPSPARAPTPTKPSSFVLETAFLAALDQEGITYSRASILSLAARVCRRLDSGDSPMQVALFVYDQGHPPYDAGFIVGAASESICQGEY